MYVSVLLIYVYIPHMCLVCTETREHFVSPGTGVIHGFELPCGCWEPNLGSLEEDPVLSPTEPSLEPQVLFHSCSLVFLS